MVDDVVRAFGYLMLGSRFKRIGERLQADATRIAAAHGVTIQSGQYAFLGALDRLGAMTIGEMAEAIGITQPGATRAVNQLVKAGLVKVRPGRDDRRQRIITLTTAGRREVEFGKQEIFPLVEAAVADLCDPLSGPLLDQLAELEKGLDDRPLIRRAPRPERSEK